MLADRDAAGERLLEPPSKASSSPRWKFRCPSASVLKGESANIRLRVLTHCPVLPDVVTTTSRRAHETRSRGMQVVNRWRRHFEMLYDLLKMIVGLAMPEVEATFLVVGAPVKLWSKPAACAEFFPDRVGEQFSPSRVCDLLDTCADNWEFLLRTSAGTPQELPEEIGTTSVAIADMQLHDKLRRRGHCAGAGSRRGLRRFGPRIFAEEACVGRPRLSMRVHGDALHVRCAEAVAR